METATGNDLSQQVLTAVLAAARRVHHEDVDETLDPVSAGFDSIAAVEMASLLEEELGVDCTIVDIFDTTSLAELAALLVQRINDAGGR
ncbi:acyl carrier protein [Streptomyces sp. NPDC086766]|uniref:acyl carrier protein n=1 Tax=Streptomyces sp. NPDC086766 TaxID=3365754 RepID=UPI00382B37C0